MFLTEGKNILRKKEIADYHISLVKSIIRKGIIFTLITGIAIMLVASLKSGMEH